jgi:hypothetical protein
LMRAHDGVEALAVEASMTVPALIKPRVDDDVSIPVSRLTQGRLPNRSALRSSCCGGQFPGEAACETFNHV